MSMKMCRLPLVLVLLTCFTSVAPALAQSVQTGVITGVINTADGLSLPGVTVTATSPNLQGPRTAVTDANGVYYLRGLAPGLYHVTLWRWPGSRKR
jgi:hypothetical protein